MMDYMIRATAADSQIRAFAASTREMTETARAAHNTSPVATAALGRLLCGGVMMGSMMKGDKDLLTLQIKGKGPIGGIVVTADSKGHAKGYVNHPAVAIPANAKGKLDVSGAIGPGMLQVIKDMGLKDPYVGSCELQTGEIAEDLTYYFAISEQVPSSVGLGVLMEKNNTVKQAGGFIIQLMPFTSDEIIDKLEKKLAEVRPVTAMLDSGMTPEMILEELLGEFGLEINEKTEISYHCDCSKERVEKALISIGKKEIREMINDGKPIEVNCHFCSKNYEFSVDELKDILEKADNKQL
ncbi:MAG: Hsp33 family molecular chaperone HslO [Lachnospiraceae bacterium]|nr:Hsp33 family molecular chaperone HslO [Lachnospiraceae bacterium]